VTGTGFMRSRVIWKRLHTKCDLNPTFGYSQSRFLIRVWVDNRFLDGKFSPQSPWSKLVKKMGIGLGKQNTEELVNSSERSGNLRRMQNNVQYGTAPFERSPTKVKASHSKLEVKALDDRINVLVDENNKNTSRHEINRQRLLAKEYYRRQDFKLKHPLK